MSDPDLSDNESDSSVVSEEEERKNLISQIERYHRYFGDVIKQSEKSSKSEEKGIASYSSATPIDKLTKDLEKCKRAVNGTTLINDASSIIVSAAVGVESIGNTFGLKLSGPRTSLSTIINNNVAAFETCIKQLFCKYGTDTMLEPEARLGLLSLQCLVACHLANKDASSIVQPIPKDNSSPNSPDPYKE